ncbi:MAG: hypothetical protein AB7V14_03620 [Kiritimatiellia bacterium]
MNPTLWRTCRMLSGATRVQLLRQLHARPGRTVSELARAAGVGVSDASQELRRIQSRGLLQADRRGSFVRYRFGADPQVSSASPLLRALRRALAEFPEERDADIVRIAQGLAHPRRIAIARALRQSPRKERELAEALGLALSSARPHVAGLVRSGLARRSGGWLVLDPMRHPLAQALVRLLAD